MLGPLGSVVSGLSAVQAGNHLVAQENVDDPAISISEYRSANLLERHSLVLSSRDPVYVDTDKVATLAARIPDKTKEATEAPSYVELLADRATWLKAEFKKLADECKQELSAEMFQD